MHEPVFNSVATFIAISLGSGVGYFLYEEEGDKTKLTKAAFIAIPMLFLIFITYPCKAHAIRACSYFVIALLISKFAVFIHNLNKKYAARKKK